MKYLIALLSFTAIAGTRTITLTWNAPVDRVTQYNLYEKIGTNTFWYGSQKVNGVYTKNGAHVLGDTFQITVDVTDNEPHLFVILAQNPYGYTWSNECLVSVVGVDDPPAAPVNLQLLPP